MNKPKYNNISEKHIKYLDNLRNSSVTNMFGAVPYLERDFPNLTNQEAKDILLSWMTNFKG